MTALFLFKELKKVLDNWVSRGLFTPEDVEISSPSVEDESTSSAVASSSPPPPSAVKAVVAPVAAPNPVSKAGTVASIMSLLKEKAKEPQSTSTVLQPSSPLFSAEYSSSYSHPQAHAVASHAPSFNGFGGNPIQQGA
jgi:hypothetical protein